MTLPIFDRVIWIVLDGVGAGALPDAAAYNDVGSNTIANTAHVLKNQHHRTLSLPNLSALGYGNITPIEGVPAIDANSKKNIAFGRAREKSCGKDTSSGHWEMAGLIVSKPFATYPDGFSQEIVDRWVKENNLPGVLWNQAASGTEIIEKFGMEHVQSGKPILYTSADSVWQVAAHEEYFGLEKLYKVCKSARVICDELQISRVIARPFVGDPRKGVPFKRTYNRKDYAQLPFGPTFLDRLSEKNVKTLGIGKISAIFAGRGVAENIDTKGNTDGIKVTLEQMQKVKKGLIYVNLIDFDMLYGHRRDVPGFAGAMEEIDQAIPEMLKQMTAKDLLIFTADHGNDPTHHGTDHTREYAPIIAYSPAIATRGAVDIGTRETFADMGATIYHALTGEAMASAQQAGRSFLNQLVQ